MQIVILICCVYTNNKGKLTRKIHILRAIFGSRITVILCHAQLIKTVRSIMRFFNSTVRSVNGTLWYDTETLY